uniref:NADH-ubiquinone oxidoreductase chain 6 n=1 Tax=Asymmetricata circumdata TaxID=1915122 RepID=A0A343A7J9_9COLE|nr:NADH dehydrogenase subunit 6 [Asymmetricata circumdata]APB92615.1 NADH dehydrogenase subunit 6 [Asymmetricata circumdata]
MLMILMITLTITFMMTTHPLSMGFILLSQTLLVAMWTGSLSLNFWYSYILFIVMVGGMLVLFIYMTSVASNEKFSFSKLFMLTISIGILLSIIILLMQLLSNNSYFDMNLEMTTFKFSLNKYLMTPMMLMSLTIIIYLFIALIAVCKITNIKYGPLRKNI